MTKQIKISNGIITAVISTVGAELKSVIKEGREILWEGDPNVWSGQSPLLFPLCGGLKDDKFVLEGKEYILPKHGFARHAEFETENLGETSATFLFKSNVETLKNYPFEFELRVTYTLVEKTIKVSYSVNNTGDGAMYYSIGSHEGYACPEGIEEYSILFEREENLEASVLDGNLLEYETVPVMENCRELPLKYEYFAIDALVFLNLKSRKAALKNNNTGECIWVDFDGCDYFLLWTKPGARYICLEPWSGIPDFVDSDYDITKKKGIIKLDKGCAKAHDHSIIFD